MLYGARKYNKGVIWEKVGGGGQMKGESPFSPQFPPVLFSYWCFLSFADLTNIGAWIRLLLLQLL